MVNLVVRVPMPCSSERPIRGPELQVVELCEFALPNREAEALGGSVTALNVVSLRGEEGSMAALQGNVGFPQMCVEP